MAAVCIVDDHELLANVLVEALARRGVTAERLAPAAGVDVAAEVLRHRPDVTLLDLDLGEHADSITLAGTLAAAGLRVLVVTGSRDRLRIAEALEQGAIGWVPKSGSFTALLSAVVTVLESPDGFQSQQRTELLTALHVARRARERDRAPFERLTTREREVLAAIADGRSVRDIAGASVVSEQTVRTQVKSLLAKLGVTSQLAAATLAVKRGWLGDR